MKAPLISSRSNPIVKWLASLCEKKYRDQSKSFLLDGEKLAQEAIAAQAEITHFVIREDREDYIALAEEYQASHPESQICVLSATCFDKITTERSPQGVAVVVKYLDNSKYSYIINNKEPFMAEDVRGIVLLDSIRDPGNLGAILRSCAAFGGSRVILSSDCADLYHPRTQRASMGAAFKLHIDITDDMPHTIELLREASFRVFAAELKSGAKSVLEVDLCARDAIVIGNEGHGISEKVSAACDGSIYIPIENGVESLNASVAASILIWEQMKK